MLADLLNLVLVGGLVGLIIAGVLAWRLRRQVRAIENHNRVVYARIAPRTEAEFLAQLHDGTLVLAPPSMW